MGVDGGVRIDAIMLPSSGFSVADSADSCLPSVVYLATKPMLVWYLLFFSGMLNSSSMAPAVDVTASGIDIRPRVNSSMSAFCPSPSRTLIHWLSSSSCRRSNSSLMTRPSSTRMTHTLDPGHLPSEAMRP